jgi:hypothetical protein
MIRKFAYSYDREGYSGAFDTPEVALAEAIKNSEGMTNPPTTVYVGTLVEADPQAQDHAEAIIDRMGQRAHVDYGDPASRYLRNVTATQARELDQAIEQTILTWLKKNKLMPTFVRVEGIREYPVMLPGPGKVANLPSNEVQEIGVSDGSELAGL